MGQSAAPRISDLLFRVCHDLRTQLRSIQVHAQLLLKNSDAARNSAGAVVDSSKRIDLLADGLASYACALDFDEGSFQSVRIDVILRAVLAGLEQELRANNAEVTYTELPCVRGDPDRLTDLLGNLLRNALKHRGEAPPRIRVTSTMQFGGWLLAVQDNGPGIEAAYLESIFQPFERLHGRQREGPGLGLTICRAIVERHGGAIWAESEFGNGCAFLFTLPAA
jgi:signal transduction histidine kinase